MVFTLGVDKGEVGFVAPIPNPSPARGKETAASMNDYTSAICLFALKNILLVGVLSHQINLKVLKVGVLTNLYIKKIHCHFLAYP